MLKKLFFIMCMLCTLTANIYAQCGPNLTGAPCAQTDIGSLSYDTGPGVAIGNPINFITGNKYDRVVDIQGKGFGLELIRHYNSFDRRAGILGQAWRFSFETQLYHYPSSIQILQADGQRIRFFQKHGVWRSEKNNQGHLTVQGKIHKRYLWQWPNGRSLVFDHNGWLVSITNTDGRYLTIHYPQDLTPNAVPHAITLTDDQGRTAAFSIRTLYPDVKELLVSVADHRLVYKIVQNRLEQVNYSPVRSLRYGYEEGPDKARRFLLTRVEAKQGLGGWTTLKTWAYDDRRRVVKMLRFDQDVVPQRLELNYDQKGVTRITDSQGSVHFFEWTELAGNYRLQRWRKQACKRCGTVIKEWRYNLEGEYSDGQNGSSVYDDLGRVTRWSATGVDFKIGWEGRTALPNRFIKNGNAFVGQEELDIEWYFFDDPRTQHWRAVPTKISFKRNHQVLKKLALEWRVQQGIAYFVKTTVLTDFDINRKFNSSWAGFKDLLKDDLAHVFVSDVTGKVATFFSPTGQVLRKEFEDGSQWLYEYDRNNRLVEFNAVTNGQASLKTKISWQNNRPLSVSNNEEKQQFFYNTKHQLVKKETTRMRDKVSYSDRYQYDQKGRLISHILPEGGRLLYGWYEDRLDSIVWQADSGRKVVLAGYLNKELTVLGQRKAYPSTIFSSLRGGLFTRQWSSYDDNHLLAEPSSQTTYNKIGLPLVWRNFKMTYNARRQLSSVDALGPEPVSTVYRYNGFGEKINAQHRIKNQSRERHYFFDQLRVVGDSNKAGYIQRRYVYFGVQPVAVLDYGAGKPMQRRWWHDWLSLTVAHPKIYGVQSNASHLPVRLIDAQGRSHWQADFSLSGQLLSEKGDRSFPLRYPGQYAEPETGLYYNYQRHYDSRDGRYIESDPLGPLEADSPYGYAHQHSQQHIDPLGLLLFAFDGTRNEPSQRTNIYLMSQWYSDSESTLDQTSFYHKGVGVNSLKDAAFAGDANSILNTQWNRLLQSLSQTGDTLTQIDLIGFSRGAALARHFANQIQAYTQQGVFKFQSNQYGLIEACINLRFLGLFDTVTQFGVLGSSNEQFNFQVAPDWDYVAHAVALNEYRNLFPLTLITGASNYTQKGFIGSHSDIGGGYIKHRENMQFEDLSDVSLLWMLDQARQAGVTFKNIPLVHREVTNPIVHDERNIIDQWISVVPRGYYDEYSRRLNANSPMVESVVIKPHQDTQAMIKKSFIEGLGVPSYAGMVEMTDYRRWLEYNYGFRW